MKTFFNILFCFFLIKASSQGPNLLFSKSIGGVANDNGNAIAVDINNNIYVAGDFASTVDFDPGPNTASISCLGQTDLFFAKYDALGNYLWAKGIGANGRETVNSIAVDKNGNLYVTGYFEDTTDFNPSLGIANLMAIGSGRDFFFAKYDTFGNYLWAKNLRNGLSDQGSSLTIDTLGNVYLTGYCSGTPDFDPGPATATLSSGVFFAKYDSNGNYIWANSLPSNGFHEGKSIKVDITGNVYLTGYYQGIMDFDPSVATATINGGNQSIFFAKYDNGGNYVWAKKIGVGGYNYGAEITLDKNNNIYLIGVFSGTTDFDPSLSTSNITSSGLGDMFFAKYNSFGDFVWVKNFGNSGWEEGYCLAVDENNNIYISGYFTSTIDFDPSTGVSNLVPINGSPEIFLAKYDASGNYIWANSFGASGNDQGNRITLDKNGNLYLIGIFQQTVDFDPGAGVTNLTAYVGSPDVFFAKYSSTVSGLHESKNDLLSVSISPNPNNGNFNLTIEQELDNGEFILLNALGQKVFKQKINKGSNVFRLNDFREGIYLYSILRDNQLVASGKLIIR